jgi:hypothetical protein
MLRNVQDGHRTWALFTCPRCAGAVIVEMSPLLGSSLSSATIAPSVTVTELHSIPANQNDQYRIEHLPSDVSSYFNDALRVMDADVPDAAAVQLRRTLEAAAAHHGIKEKVLVTSIQQMIDRGLITKDFGPVLHHVRKIGNLGAHATDERLNRTEVERALRFTMQVLRNLFEVPGELEALRENDDTEES